MIEDYPVDLGSNVIYKLEISLMINLVSIVDDKMRYVFSGCEQHGMG